MELSVSTAEDRPRERFAQAVAEHGRAMFRAARAVVDSDADAEDAVGEAVLRAWQGWSGLRRQEAVRAWLLKITLHCAYEQHRRRGPVSTGELPEVAAPAEDPDTACDLWQAVMRLPRQQRAVVVLFYYEDMTVQQIARLLGLAQGTVKSRLNRARESLRAMLGEEEQP